MTAIGIMITLIQVAAFIASAVFGARVCDRLTNKWHALIIAGVALVFVGAYMVTVGEIPDEWTRAFGFMLIGFAGGLVARARHR